MINMVLKLEHFDSNHGNKKISVSEIEDYTIQMKSQY